MKQSILKALMVVLSGVPVMLISQVNLRIDPNIVKPSVSELSQEKEATLLETTKDIINAYAERISMLDPVNNFVSNEAAENFRKLFHASATLPEDFKKEIRLDIPIVNYCDEVSTKLENVGIQVSLDDIVLKEIMYDPDGYYKMKLGITKTRYNYINTSGMPETNSSGDVIKQVMTISIPANSLETGWIRSLEQVREGKSSLPPEYDFKIAGLSIGVGTGSLSYAESALWETANPGSQLMGNNGLNLSFGLDYNTTRLINARKSPKKNWLLSVGIRYAVEQINTNLDQFSLPKYETTASDSFDTEDYIRDVGAMDGIDGLEKLNLSVLEAYIGLGYRVINKRNTKFYITGKVVPRFTLSNSGEFAGEGTYDGVILMDNGETSDFRFLRPGAINPNLLYNPLGAGPYQVGNYNLSSSVKSELQATFAFQLSPTLYLDLTDDNPTWGISIGLDLAFHPTYLGNGNHFLDHSLQYPDTSLEGSLLEYYAESISAFTYGFTIGLYRKKLDK